MTATRRHFLHTAAVAGGGLSLGLLGCSGGGTGEVRRARNPLRILILGGTGFIGPHQVEYALKRGHTLTLFNRGRTNPHLFPDVEKLFRYLDSLGDILESDDGTTELLTYIQNSRKYDMEVSANLLYECFSFNTDGGIITRNKGSQIVPGSCQSA